MSTPKKLWRFGYRTKEFYKKPPTHSACGKKFPHIPKRRKQTENYRVRSSGDAFPPIRISETVVVSTDGSTYQAQMGHPAYTPGTLILDYDTVNVFRWVDEKTKELQRLEFEETLRKKK